MDDFAHERGFVLEAEIPEPYRRTQETKEITLPRDLWAKIGGIEECKKIGIDQWIKSVIEEKLAIDK
jgi:hypothetical protein